MADYIRNEMSKILPEVRGNEKDRSYQHQDGDTQSEQQA